MTSTLEISLKRQLAPGDITCPAGTLVGDASCRCNIEQRTVEGHLEPSSIEAFCANDYAACTTWQAMKKVEEAGGDFAKILATRRDEATKAKINKQLRDARLRAAQKLMVEDSARGRAFRRRLKLGEFADAA